MGDKAESDSSSAENMRATLLNRPPLSLAFSLAGACFFAIMGAEGRAAAARTGMGAGRAMDGGGGADGIGGIPPLAMTGAPPRLYRAVGTGSGAADRLFGIGSTTGTDSGASVARCS